MERFLLPFTIVMRRLKYRQKLALIGVILFSFIISTAFLLVKEINREIASVEQDKEAISNHQIQNKQIETKLDSLFDQLVLSNLCMSLQQDSIENCQRLSQSRSTLKQSMNDDLEFFAAHQKLVATLALLMFQLNDNSGFKKNPQSDHINHNLVKFYILHGHFDQMLSLAMSASMQQREGDQHLQMYLDLNLFNSILEDLAINLEDGLDHQTETRQLLTGYMHSLRIFSEQIVNPIMAMSDSYPSTSQVTAAGLNVMDTGSRLFEDLIHQLENDFHQQLQLLEKKKLLYLCLFGLVSMLSICLFAGFYLTVIESVYQLTYSTRQLAEGKLHARMRLNSRDELKMVESAFNSMAEGFGAIVNDRESKEDQIKQLAYYDPLTGLPNRSLFNDRLKVALANAKRNQQLLGIIFIDLDNFKRINDTLGHHAGDSLLVAVGERLAACVRESDTVARLGGDEFIMIVSALTVEEDIEGIIYKVMDSLAIPIHIDNKELYISASIGVSIYPKDGVSGEILIQKADQAMYEVKGEGKRNYKRYSGELDAKNKDKLELESMIRKSLIADEFIVYYQPIFDIHSGLIIGVEALARWQHPQNGLLGPKRFLDVAEETGLIIPIDLIVLEKACADMKSWHAAGREHLTVSVNLSTKQLKQNHLLAHLKGILQMTQFRSDRLLFEFDENRLSSEDSISKQNLAELRRMGVRISIDKFGKGASSLDSMKKIPFDELKIDRDFVKDIPYGQKDTAITSSLATLGHKLGLRVIAVGVESGAQLEFLKQLKCNAAQGLYFSSPLTPYEISKMLSSQ